jgi:hypothetical protein
MQIMAIAARAARLVVPALFAGITALGVTAFAPDAAARDTTPNQLARYSRFNEPKLATHPSAAPQGQAGRSTSAATGTYSQRSNESGGATKVTVDQLKRYSRWNESRH